MRNKNLLLGYGETLSYKINTPGGGGPKAHPYIFEDVKERLMESVDTLLSKTSSVPPLAKPNGKYVAKITIHPTYLAKSYYPSALISKLGLVDLGSKLIKVTPRNQTTKVKKVI